MNKQLLQKHANSFARKYASTLPEAQADRKERAERIKYYQAWTSKHILQMKEDDIYEYLAKLWAMRMWGNKHYKVDRIISDNGLAELRSYINDLVWGSEELDKRWDSFKAKVKGVGAAMMSEILCHVHPHDCIIWNRKAYNGLDFLGVQELPLHDYQLTGKTYQHLITLMKEIKKELQAVDVKNANLLTVDYFIWDELQAKKSTGEILPAIKKDEVIKEPISTKTLHNEVRDKLAEIGEWLGFQTYTERKVAEGSQVDTVWEATIGNMGRVIYVFEVQTRGSIDSLILNLLKAMNNPAVQGVVAVSDGEQLERIKKHAADVGDLHRKLRYWDYQEVLQIHESLEDVNRVINSLGLVPEGF